MIRKILCRLGIWHAYGAWAAGDKGYHIKRDGHVTGVFQARTCAICGKVIVREVLSI